MKTISIQTEGFETVAAYMMKISNALWKEVEKGKSFKAEIEYDPKAHTTIMRILSSDA